MSRFYGILPVAGDDEETSARATLSDEQKRRKIEAGEIRSHDLSVTERERYREELKKGSLRTGYPSSLTIDTVY